MALPLELLDNVFATLAPADLLVLARTSPAFFPIAQRHLYRSISLGPSTKNPLVVVLLARNPHLARCVRSFHVRMEPRSPIFSSFYTALAKALVNMTGLESLELSLTTCSSSVLRAAISDPTVSYPRLRHFSSSIPFDSTVVDFLSKAPILDSLSLDHIPDPKSPPLTPLVPPSILPALSQFTGPLHAALALVPSRPLASVQLHDGDLTEEIVETLAASSQNLLNFSASTSSPPLPILRSISRSMSNLVYLRLMNTQNFLDVPDRVSLVIRGPIPTPLMSSCRLFSSKLPRFYMTSLNCPHLNSAACTGTLPNGKSLKQKNEEYGQHPTKSHFPVMPIIPSSTTPIHFSPTDSAYRQAYVTF